MIVETPGEKSDPTTYSRDDKSLSMEEAEAPRERERGRDGVRERRWYVLCAHRSVTSVCTVVVVCFPKTTWQEASARGIKEAGGRDELAMYATGELYNYVYLSQVTVYSRREGDNRLSPAAVLQATQATLACCPLAWGGHGCFSQQTSPLFTRITGDRVSRTRNWDGDLLASWQASIWTDVPDSTTPPSSSPGFRHRSRTSSWS